ncbi:MAG TPA: hypothetical protein PLG94_14765 [Smithellaceae bacterium]|nr:hypothetical protein [Smithellaceae bacterium]HPL67791.1 hypothetical protein [Smithellaceae bacterium]
MTITTDPRYIKTEYNSEQAHLLSLGIQFYISGRVTYLFCKIDAFLVTPLLFRHAIEYFLKGDLSFSHKMSELRKYKHDLSKLWKVFKEEEPGNNFDKFDSFIKQFNNTELMRYPKGKDTLKPGQKEACEIDVSLSFDETLTDIEPGAVSWSINTVDEIIYSICNRMRSPLSTVDWIQQRYRENEALFMGNCFFKKPENEGPLIIQLRAPALSNKE